MKVFDLRNQLIKNYSDYIQSFIHINDHRIQKKVSEELQAGLLWPNPLIQLNPAFEQGATIPELVQQELLHPECNKIFQKDKDEKGIGGRTLRLYKHQTEAIREANRGNNYVLTTGTGSGKSLAYIIPIVDYVLKNGSGKGIKAIIVYPMNALANSQEGELQKFLNFGYPNNSGPVTFARYTGQERDEVREKILANPPDILLTNYVMLELILTRPVEKPLVEASKGIRFFVFDELHTYRGRQGADVALLIRRAKDAFQTTNVQCIGTSATVAGQGTHEEQRKDVSSIASLIFGTTFKPENVIGETLKRSTPEFDFKDKDFISKLKKRIEDSVKPSKTYKEFIFDPLSSWIETVFGLTKEVNSNRLIRSKPRSISGEDGAAKDLSDLTGVPVKRCIHVIEEHLLGSYECEPNPETGFPVFAFRLHQFISRGDTVYASIEKEEERFLTVRGQQYVPGDRKKILLPLIFCRECGQEYYCVRRSEDPETRTNIHIQRELSDRLSDEQSEAGFIYLNSTDPWPEDIHEVMDRLPDEWLEEHRGTTRIKPARQEDLPRAIRLGVDGKESESGNDCHFISAPFRFCLKCGVSYGFRQTSDFPKLTSLASEGRSTATTILSLGSIQYLLKDNSLRPRARKLLSFTDNRQDASLQAGHFNDFVETGILRSAILKAAMASGKNGMHHDDIVQKVFDALDLPIELYASDPDVRFQALEETRKALRAVLGYRLYRDLKKGWRITAPNLEQCGLIEIKYLSLDEVCKAEDLWQNTHPALATASPDTRQKVAKTLLDYMRRELAIKVDYLDQIRQEQIQQQSSQRLIAPWAIDENERPEHASVLFPRSRTREDYQGNTYLSPRGGFGQYIRRNSTFPELNGRVQGIDDTQEICRQLLEALRIGGLTEIVAQPRNAEEIPGYQIPASALLWIVADGSKPFYDPIRVPRASETGGRTNPFFIEFYKSIADVGKGLEAREHTAQVQYDARIERENRFREGRLPILFCSPTMELGVDIAELNAVNLRNMPPTPANYAQRSGRAGRSGQPALVFTYCSTYSSHDQYFFRRPNLMVAGSVKPPRIDLANEDLVRSHIHAIWLTASSQSLGRSLVDILNLQGENPTLELSDSVKDSIKSEMFNKTALATASKILESMKPYFANAEWYTERWLQDILSQLSNRFEQSCERWRNLYRAAKKQYIIQNKIAIDHTRSQEDRNKAKRLSAEARSQLELLTEAQNVFDGDFYSYRYFASEGFLPGYNFPRLPLSAYIPGRRQKSVRDEFLSRPRFLAISEFGPRAIIYHEGSRYRINKVILPIEDQSEAGDVVTSRIKQCSRCGYIHPIFEGDGPDLCECCKEPLGVSLNQLFRIQNVATRRTDKINSDEEERLRIGYEIKTGIRFVEHSCGLSSRLATVKLNNEAIAELTYGDTATIWRMNLGWVRRARREQYGFVLDVERGYWAKNEQESDDDDQDPMSARVRRVIPYVEDRRNCLIYTPLKDVDSATLISLQAAFKNAIQVEYQLEESELSSEPLPTRDDPKNILFYESSEGGAGVLKRLIEDPAALSRVAQTALQLCHFSESGEDLRMPPGSREECEAACYDCLMSYTNQYDHSILDRQKIKNYLLDITKAQVFPSPRGISRNEHLERLIRQSQTGLEKNWLTFINEKNLRLPSRAQAFIETCKTSPDFIYDELLAAIYVDGHPHKFEDRQKRDAQQTNCMEDHGYTVIRFKANEDWDAIIKQYPNIFGRMECLIQ